MGHQLPPPSNDIPTPLTQPSLLLQSVISTNHPKTPCHVWHSHSRQGKAGLDHILTRQSLMYQDQHYYIDHTVTPQLLSSDHALIYANFILRRSTIPSTTDTQTTVHFQNVAQIPLRVTNPNKDSPAAS